MNRRDFLALVGAVPFLRAEAEPAGYFDGQTPATWKNYTFSYPLLTGNKTSGMTSDVEIDWVRCTATPPFPEDSLVKLLQKRRAEHHAKMLRDWDERLFGG